MKAKSIVASAAVAILGFALVVSAAGYTFSNYLSVGSTGTDVVNLQNFLMANGYNIASLASGAAQPGYFGSQTQAAVEAYQAAKGIPSTGFVGPLTVASLNNKIASGQGGGTVSLACPAGFTCTPIVNTSTTCPAGMTCTSNTTGTNGTVTIGTAITTPGVSGTLTIAQSGSVANGATFNTGQTVGIAGFKLQAGPSDMQVNTITADFNVRPWLYFGSFSLVNQTTGQVLVPSIPLSAASFTEITASEDYRITIGGLNFVVPHGQQVNIVINGLALSGISQTLNTYISLIAASVRSLDGTGVTDTENVAATGWTLGANAASQLGSVLYNGNQTANLVVTIDPSSPTAQVIQTQTGSVTNNVPLAIFDVQAQNNTATLQGLTVNLAMSTTTGYAPVPATLANVINTVQLVANGNTYYGNLASSGNTGTVVFNSNVSIPLPLGVNKQLKIVANINQGVTGVLLSASLVTPGTQGISSNFVGVDNNYNTPTVAAGGTVSGAVTTFSTLAAVAVVPAGVGIPSYTATTQSNKTGNYAVTWPFSFTVSAGTSPIYIAATPASAVKLATDLAGVPGVSGAASTTVPTSISGGAFLQGDTNTGLGSAATGSFYVPSNSSRTFTVNAIINNFSNTTPDNSAQVQIAGVYYGSASATTTQVIATSSESFYSSNLTSLQSTPVSLLTQ